jgi:putative ABC transport system permease protein
MSLELLLTGLLQGLILSLVAYALMIPFRLLNFPDLTAEGAYPLGGAICATALIAGCNPILAILLAMLGAGLLGMATSVVSLRLKVNSMLAGIILSTMAYSVNLRIMSKPNIALFDTAKIFAQNNIIMNIFILSFIIAILIIPLAAFLRTEFGLRMRAVGLNADFSIRQGISVAKYTVFGLFVANAFTGLAGGLIVQLQSYMDISIGIGIVIHALAALMIGESIVGNRTLNQQLLAPLVGAIIYQQLQGVVLSCGLAPSDLKFFTGLVVLAVIAMQRGKYMAIVRRT